MPPHQPTYVWKKAPRFVPGLGTLACLAGAAFIAGKLSSANADPNISTADPVQQTPWPPPSRDVLDDVSRPYVRSRYQNREMTQWGQEKHCTDRNWITFSDRPGTAMIHELHRLVRADGTNECTNRTWLATTKDDTEVCYLNKREVGRINGPMQKIEGQKCKKKNGGAWECEAREFLELHRRRVLGRVVLEPVVTPPPAGYVDERAPDARAECPPKMPEEQGWWAAAGRLMDERFLEGGAMREEGRGQGLLVGDEEKSSA